jgi:CPA1 family monovalent cation:H+ antiporter
MFPSILLGACIVAVAALANMAADRLRLPRAILLVLVGVLLAFVPGTPAVPLDPQLVLLLLLPPLLYSAGVGMSWRGLRANLRPIALLAVGCVLFTATAVAAAAHWGLGLPWAVAFVLGAVVSPPDPVAPMAIARRLKLPQRLLTILEGEGLANDATALILLSFAVAAVQHGAISLASATGGFLVIVASDVAWGWMVGWATLRFRSFAREPQVEIVLSLLTPYVAFWVPHGLGGSGVLAAITAGLYVSWNGRRFISPTTRLHGYFVWGLVVHLINAVLFLLVGLQARMILSDLDGGGWRRLLLAGALVGAVVIVVRFVWVFPATYLPRRLIPGLAARDPAPPWRATFLIGFTGIRGVVSLVGALSIPLTLSGGPFPERGLILFVTFSVILATLVGQGSCLPWMIRTLGLAQVGEEEAAKAKLRELAARVRGVAAALSELDRLEGDGADQGTVKALRRRQQDRFLALTDTADTATVSSPVVDEAFLQARLIAAERSSIAAIYDAGQIGDDARRRIERELDLEDARNRHALESATGDTLADPEAEAPSALS